MPGATIMATKSPSVTNEIDSERPTPSKTELPPPADKMGFLSVLRIAVYTSFAAVVGYFIFLTLLAIPFFQNQVIYLNSVTMTWFQDVNIPEQWGFLRNQVTPFTLSTPDGERLHAWHILPLGVYQQHKEELVQESDGMALDIKSRIGFQLLRDDPDALLVLYLHGAAGTLASGFRPLSYRAIYAGAPGRIHTVAIDYRGFGTSTGIPSEEGLLTDALTIVDWAINEAGIPPSRIVLFGQSLGTAVAISLVHHLSSRPDPILFAGMVLVAQFADMELLTATYRVAGTIPILDPLAYFPRLLSFFNTFILHEWPSQDKLGDIIRLYHDMPNDKPKFHITLIHAQDDYDIPWSHSDRMFRHAVNAVRPPNLLSRDETERIRRETITNLGSAGWVSTYETGRGTIREEIAKWGLHNRIMSYPIVSVAVLRAFEGEAPPKDDY